MNRIDILIKSRDTLRVEWRSARDELLSLKKNLAGEGMALNKIRTRRDIKNLRKMQHSLSRRIIHLEKKINRMDSNEKTGSEIQK